MVSLGVVTFATLQPSGCHIARFDLPLRMQCLVHLLTLICAERVQKKRGTFISNAITGTTNPHSTNEKNAHAYTDTGVQSFYVLYYAKLKHNAKLVVLLLRKKAERFDIYFKERIPMLSGTHKDSNFLDKVFILPYFF